MINQYRIYFVLFLLSFFVSCTKDTIDPLHFTRIYNSSDPTRIQIVSVQQLKTGQYFVLMKDMNSIPSFQVINEDGSIADVDPSLNQHIKRYTVDFGLKQNSDGKLLVFLNQQNRDGFEIFSIKNEYPIQMDSIGEILHHNANFNVTLLDFKQTSDKGYIFLYQSNFDSIIFSKSDGLLKNVISKHYDFNPNAAAIFPYYPILGVNRLEHFISEDTVLRNYSFKSFFKNQCVSMTFDQSLNLTGLGLVASNECEPVHLGSNIIYCTPFDEYCQYTIRDANQSSSALGTNFTQYDQDGTKYQTLKLIQINNKHFMVAAGTSKHGRAILIFFDGDKRTFITAQNYGSGNSLESEALVITRDNGIALFGNTDVVGFISKPFMIKLSEADIVDILKSAGYKF